MKLKLNILIATIQSRQYKFRRLKEKLDKQISENLLSHEVEVIHFLDNGERSIGFKRNSLIEKAQGHFVVFVDDDDDISDDYVPSICNAISNNPDIDCIGIKGKITFNNKMPRTFIHSLQYRDYFTKKKILFRPPYHLNPVRREIARRYRFEDISYSEDIDFAMKMLQDGALKKEHIIDSEIYFYHSRRPWLYQLFLELTEPIRHPLGLKLVNRIRIKRWLNPKN